MDAVDNAPVAAEIADVVDRVFTNLFIFLFIKWGGPNRKRKVVCELVFMKIGDPKKWYLE